MMSCLLKNEPASVRIFSSLTKFNLGKRSESKSLNGQVLIAPQKMADGPKPGDLTMSRVNPDENRGEARTRHRCKGVG